MRIEKDIPYHPEHGMRGLGDLYLPDAIDHAPCALVIHGGGWNAMDKQGLAGVAMLLAEEGFAAFAINYRLLDDAPWPACGDDCLAAARFMRGTDMNLFKRLQRERLFVIGGSAGGHLALMTGLRLPVEQVSGIVSLAGPTDLLRNLQHMPKKAEPYRHFLGTEDGPDEEALLKASPIAHIIENAPPILCVHSVRDGLVPLWHSEVLVKAAVSKGVAADLFIFEGNDQNHGFWVPQTDPRRLLPEIEERIRTFTKGVREA